MVKVINIRLRTKLMRHLKKNGESLYLSWVRFHNSNPMIRMWVCVVLRWFSSQNTKGLFWFRCLSPKSSIDALRVKMLNRVLTIERERSGRTALCCGSRVWHGTRSLSLSLLRFIFSGCPSRGETSIKLEWQPVTLYLHERRYIFFKNQKFELGARAPFLCTGPPVSIARQGSGCMHGSEACMQVETCPCLLHASPFFTSEALQVGAACMDRWVPEWWVVVWETLARSPC